jgi:hypothetical protein
MERDGDASASMAERLAPLEPMLKQSRAT